MKLKQIGNANTSRKQILVFVNGLLQQDSVDYDWDSIDDVPMFRNELFDKDFVIVLTIDATFGNSLREYEVENPENVRYPNSSSGSIFIHHEDDENATYDEDGNCTGGTVRITAGKANSGSGGSINILTGTSGNLVAGEGLEFQQDNGGDLILKSGAGWKGGDAGEIKIGGDECGDINIVSSSRINIKAPKINFDGAEDAWETFSTLKSD